MTLNYQWFQKYQLLKLNKLKKNVSFGTEAQGRDSTFTLHHALLKKVFLLHKMPLVRFFCKGLYLLISHIIAWSHADET